MREVTIQKEIKRTNNNQLMNVIIKGNKIEIIDNLRDSLYFAYIFHLYKKYSTSTYIKNILKIIYF